MTCNNNTCFLSSSTTNSEELFPTFQSNIACGLPTYSSPGSLSTTNPPSDGSFPSDSLHFLSGTPSPTSPPDLGVILPAQQNFSSSGSLSSDGTSSHSSPINVVCTLSSHTWLPEMVTGLHTSMSTNSIPSVSTLVPFQNSETSEFVPQVPPLTTVFSLQIPPNFNFSSNNMFPNHHQNCDNLSRLEFSMLEPQHCNTSNPQINPDDSLVQQLLDEIIALNDDSDFSAVPIISGHEIVNIDTALIPQSKSVTTSTFNTLVPFQGTCKNVFTPSIRLSNQCQMR